MEAWKSSSTTGECGYELGEKETGILSHVEHVRMPKLTAPKVALAIGAHPDDIEFMMGGTIELLGQAGYETHYLNLANGSCGSTRYSGRQLARIRNREARSAARILSACFHPSLVDDLDIYYERTLLRQLAAIVRDVNPSILLVPSPQDYMEDHTNACRLAVTAAFVRGMRNFSTTPLRNPVSGDVTVYHAMPHGLRDPLRRRVVPGAYVNTISVQETKRAALACHRSQQEWLDVSQQMNQYIRTMENFARELGRMSHRFKFAEGWRRHLHYGFCAENADPLADALGRNYLVNPEYEDSL
jgi:N-acetylglucosamine malate deacetylase 1